MSKSPIQDVSATRDAGLPAKKQIHNPLLYPRNIIRVIVLLFKKL